MENSCPSRPVKGLSHTKKQLHKIGCCLTNKKERCHPFQPMKAPNESGCSFCCLFQFKAHADTFRLESPCNPFDALGIRQIGFADGVFDKQQQRIAFALGHIAEPVCIKIGKGHLNLALSQNIHKQFLV